MGEEEEEEEEEEGLFRANVGGPRARPRYPGGGGFTVRLGGMGTWLMGTILEFAS